MKSQAAAGLSYKPLLTADAAQSLWPNTWPVGFWLSHYGCRVTLAEGCLLHGIWGLRGHLGARHRPLCTCY